MNTYILEEDIEDIIIEYIKKEWQNHHTKCELALILNEIQTKRNTFKERAYEHILYVFVAFWLWYIASIQDSIFK